MEKPGLISQVQVQKAVEALMKISQKSENTNTLFSDVDAVHLQFAVKKIDAKQRKLPLKLPNGLNRQQEVCLFVKDLDKSDRDYEQTVRHFKRSLKELGIQCISQVIPLKALKLEYKPFEAKRKLSNSFDVFLADARIIRLLPSFLGKAFYGRKRQPIQIRMDSKDLKGEIEAAISNSQCHWSGKGSVGMATVGYMDMSPAELVQNITASAEQIAAAIPGGAINVRSMYIKTARSLSIPIHMSMGSANDVKLEVTKRERTPVVTDEVTTVEDGLVKVYPSGVVKVVNQTQKASGSKTLARVGKKRKTVKRIGKHQKKSGMHQKKSGKRQKKRN